MARGIIMSAMTPPGNRVKAGPAGADEHDCRYDYGYGSQGIVHDFEERRFHVHVVFTLRCEDED